MRRGLAVALGCALVLAACASRKMPAPATSFADAGAAGGAEGPATLGVLEEGDDGVGARGHVL
ncbi:MAG: hypothetical protein ACK4MT_03045, partial [Thermaurantiacus tibetensis]